MGRVQGVWFRGWTVREARRRNLEGWVRNRLDGAVEALFSGDRDAIDSMIAACHSGPRAADVLSVERFSATEDEVRGRGFDWLPTE